jgi:hypothetical protein
MNNIACVDLEVSAESQDMEDILNGASNILESLIEVLRNHAVEQEGAQAQAKVFGMVFLSETASAIIEAGQKNIVNDRKKSGQIRTA